jgi:hypothetical protein
MPRFGCDRIGAAIETGMRRAAAALFGEAIAGVVQHQLAHRARRQREEVRAILHGVGAGAVEAQVTLVDQRGRVQRALSAGEHAAGDALEIVVDQGDGLRPGRLDRRHAPCPGVR